MTDTDTTEAESQLKPLNDIDRDRLNATRRRHEEALKKYEDERYRYAQVIEAYYKAEYDLSEFLPEDQEEKFFDWKEDYELRNAQQAAIARERFAQANALREAKRQRRAAKYATA